MKNYNTENNFIPLKNIPAGTKISKVLFDFDGTISTFRHGWETVMIPMMEEILTQGKVADEKLKKEIGSYVDQSTGIQTIHQMKWLTDKVNQKFPNLNADMWEYKALYNHRLMQMIQNRIKSVESGIENPESYRIPGSFDFMSFLKDEGYKLYLASGSDHPDVRHEAEILEVAPFFEKIAGAPLDKVSCSKRIIMEEIIKNDLEEKEAILIIGDGKVEIALGAEYGMPTLGLATIEEKSKASSGKMNERKMKRLITAGADALAADFTPREEIFNWFKL